MIAIGLVIAIKKSPPIVEEFESGDLDGQSPLEDSAVEQALRVRRRRAVLQCRSPGLYVDVPDPVLAAGAERITAVGRLPPAGQPDRVPHLAVRHDVGHRQGPRDEGAFGARRARGRALHLRDVLAERGRRGRRRRVVVLPVADVPDDLRRRTPRTGSRNEIRRRRAGDGDRRRGDHAADPGRHSRRDQSGDLVHRPRRLLRRRHQLRRLRPESRTPHGWRTTA